MLRPRAIYLKNPIEMHYMKNGPESQLRLFQFHECYFFIKVRGAKYCTGPKTKEITKRLWGPPLSASQIIKNSMEQAQQLGQHLFAL